MTVPDDRDVEALRLIKAFHKVSHPEVRRIIMSIVEAAARGATVKVEDATALQTPSKLEQQSRDQNIDDENRLH